jgi:hypothetical protein
MLGPFLFALVPLSGLSLVVSLAHRDNIAVGARPKSD